MLESLFNNIISLVRLINRAPISVICCPGGDQCSVVHAAVPFWSVLLVHPSQRARVSKHCLDIRVHRSEAQGKD